MADELEVFIGEWKVEAVFPEDSGIPNTGEAGSAGFEWLGGREFMVQRSQVPDPAPDSLAVLGRDPEGDGFLQHYFDARGVARIYKMSLEDGVWKLWRDEADFSPLQFRQRFTGRFSEDGRRIEGAWERTGDDGAWMHDFDLIYTRTD